MKNELEKKTELALSIEDMEGYQCTCGLKYYEPHTCPYAEEISNSLEECSCCPFCEKQCAWDI